MKSYTYLIVDLGCLFIPLLASFYPKHAFYKEWKFFFPANLIVAVLFLVWDYYFTEHGIWGFNPDYLTGIYVLNLPLEEILFFICIPYACVFTYFALQYLVKKNPLRSFQKPFSFVLIAVLLIVGLFSLDKWYTGMTFLLTATYLFYLRIRKTDLSLWYYAYFLILPFFLLSNGVLTGTGLESPIVWYNDAENLGIRMLSIPVEDSIYGMLMIFMNIHLYRLFKEKSIAKIAM